MRKYSLLLCKFIVFFTLLFLTVSCSLSNLTHVSGDFGKDWQSVSCKTFDVPDSIAQQSDCGYIKVPEQSSVPNGPSIQLAVVRVRSNSKTPTSDALFVEQGGPGDTTIGVFVNYALPVKSPGLVAFLENRDLIFVEERGTRYSQPFLSCPEINAHNIEVAKGKKEYTDKGWIQACNERFIRQNVNPSAFNTRENASDIYAVAETLGYKNFNFYGGSYGTLLGQYVIAQADKHKSKLRSAILDGVVRPDIDFNLAFSHTISFALRNLFNDCALDQACNKAYPNLKTKFLNTIDKLNKNPIPITLTVPSTKEKIVSKLDGNSFIDGILPTLLITSDDHVLPKQIHAASQGNFDWIAETLSSSLESDNAKEMYNTVLCARTKSIRVTPSEVLPPPFPQMLSISRRESDLVKNACDVLKVELKPPFVYENTDIPVLILNGAYDPVTPQPYGEAVAKNFKTAYVYTFSGIGHISLILKPSTAASKCSAQIANDFISNPNQRPDGQCLSQIKPRFSIKNY